MALKCFLNCIVNTKFLKCYSKVKARAPANSRALCHNGGLSGGSESCCQTDQRDEAELIVCMFNGSLFPALYAIRMCPYVPHNNNNHVL